MADDLEILPGGWSITNRNARKFFLEEGDFEVYSPEGEKHLISPNSNFVDFYEVWENYHYFGLPNGGGWVDEYNWLLDFLKFFDKIHDEIKMFNSKRRA